MNSENHRQEHKHGWPPLPPCPPQGMLVDLKKLRNRGQKISPEEYNLPAIRCRIRFIRNADDRGMAFKFRSQAVIQEPLVGGGGAGAPLFDPGMEDWNCSGIFLAGWEISSGDGGTGSTQHYQVWQIIPVTEAPK